MINESVNPIDLLDRMLDSGEDIWETAVSIGMQDENEMTIRRWRQGDVVMRVEGAYGDGIITKYAVALNMPTSTLKQRRTMSRYYPLDTRVSYPDLGYSHYREAMRIGDLDESIKALELASQNEWPVWELADYVNEHLGKEKESSESHEGLITGRYTENPGQFITIRFPHDIKWKVGQKVVVKIKD